jgi:hypothetical protein
MYGRVKEGSFAFTVKNNDGYICWRASLSYALLFDSPSREHLSCHADLIDAGYNH